MSSDPYPYVIGGITCDPAVTIKNGQTLTIPYTITMNHPIIGTYKSSGPWTVTGTGGTWAGVNFDEYPPDMTDWPADDIIDWFARELARRQPA